MDAAPVALDEDVWGAAPTEAELAGVQLSAQSESEARLARVRAASVSVDEAARRAGVAVDALAAAVGAGRLLSVPAGDGNPLIPTWQLAGSATVDTPAVAGVSDLARAFPGSTVALSLWACRPSADLDGRSPAQALADGDVDAVVATAKALTAAGW